MHESASIDHLPLTMANSLDVESMADPDTNKKANSAMLADAFACDVKLSLTSRSCRICDTPNVAALPESNRTAQNCKLIITNSTEIRYKTCSRIQDGTM